MKRTSLLLFVTLFSIINSKAQDVTVTAKAVKQSYTESAFTYPDSSQSVFYKFRNGGLAEDELILVLREHTGNSQSILESAEQFGAINSSLKTIFFSQYGVEGAQINIDPKLDSKRFDVLIHKAKGDKTLISYYLELMLKEQFGINVSEKITEVSAWVFLPAKDPSKQLKPDVSGRMRTSTSNNTYTAEYISVDMIAMFVQMKFGETLINTADLDGAYSFSFEFGRNDDAKVFLNKVAKALGVKLEKKEHFKRKVINVE